jgi:hypothetical protein
LQRPAALCGQPSRSPQAARSLSRTLDLLAVLRGGRRAEEVRRLEEQAGRLEARLAGMVTAEGGRV